MKKKVIEEYSPLISIVIPVYNRQNVIGRLLEVLKQQTYQNLEIICIDDGSTDQSKSVIQRHMEADPRIILKEKENGGGLFQQYVWVFMKRVEIMFVLLIRMIW